MDEKIHRRHIGRNSWAVDEFHNGRTRGEFGCRRGAARNGRASGRSNREPAEWLTMTSDAMVAQLAIDRLTQGAHILVVEGPSWRQRETLNRRAPIDENKETGHAH